MSVHKNGGAEDGPSLDRLIKFLRLSASSVDGEALAAIRQANKELAKIGGDWEALLRGKVTIITDPFLDGTMNAAVQRHSPVKPPPPPPRRPPPQPAPQSSGYQGFSSSQPAQQPQPGYSVATMRTSRSNSYASKCHLCNTMVAQYDGYLCTSSTGWKVEHRVCPPKQPKPAKKAYVGDKTVDDLMNL